MTTLLNEKEIWFITGSQRLYGNEVLKQVHQNSMIIVEELNASSHIPIQFIWKGVLKNSEEISAIFQQANMSSSCIGVVAWMHTFSPAKMWIKGLREYNKPLCHLHTQFNAEIPWNKIDMDYMNLHQSAHGGREFGFMLSRMHKRRKVIVGHWKSESVQRKLGVWTRVALGWSEFQQLKVARIGDNMRDVAVTEGDKVAAEINFGVRVNGYAPTDIIAEIEKLSDDNISALLQRYQREYRLSENLKPGGAKRNSLIEAAKIELGLRAFLEQGGFMAFTDTFENLGELKQLPGIAVQRLMADGYGFGAEGDWKTAALLRIIKVMATGMNAGTSFMEDYTYHFTNEKSYVLGSHMLEICPSIAADKPSCEVHPLEIGGKNDPVRLVFRGKEGRGINISLIDLGGRFRLVVNEVEAVNLDYELPNLPVAHVLLDTKPSLETAASAWILAGGAHHTVYTQALTVEYIEDLADIFGVELLVIDKHTNIRDFKDKINANAAYYHLLRHQM